MGEWLLRDRLDPRRIIRRIVMHAIRAFNQIICYKARPRAQKTRCVFARSGLFDPAAERKEAAGISECADYCLPTCRSSTLRRELTEPFRQYSTIAPESLIRFMT